jgi:hypothetical protein
MTGPGGDVLGIRLRLPNGRKLAVRRGQEGLFIPEGLSMAGTMLVCEGPTDTAALLDLGFDAVGRPSCRGGVRLLVEWVERHRPSDVVIVRDADGPGIGGAESLAAVLVAYAKAVRVIAPPTEVKDARQWVQQGATQQDIAAAIEKAPRRRLPVRTHRRKAGQRGQ